MFRFEQLEIWELSLGYADACYNVIKCFPKEELHSLSDQLRRAAVSISNNIAEGSTGTNKNFLKYLEHSLGSILETVNIFSFAERRQYISANERERLYGEAEKLVRKIRSFKRTLYGKE